MSTRATSENFTTVLCDWHIVRNQILKNGRKERIEGRRERGKKSSCIDSGLGDF